MVKKGLRHYSEGTETIASYLELGEWNKTEIEKRAQFLFIQAKTIWKTEDIEIASA